MTIEEIQAYVAIGESITTTAVLVGWLVWSGRQIAHERESRKELSDDIREDWKALKQIRANKMQSE